MTGDMPLALVLLPDFSLIRLARALRRGAGLGAAAGPALGKLLSFVLVPALLFVMLAPAYAARPGGGPVAELLEASKNSLREGAFAEAERKAREALALVRQRAGEGDPRTAGALNMVGNTLVAQGRYAEAEALQREALALRQKAMGPDADGTERVMFSLAWTLRAAGKFAEAETLMRRCLALRERLSGPGDPDTARRLAKLAVLLTDEARYEEAEQLVRRSLAAVEAAWAGRDNEVTAGALQLLARIAQERGRAEEAAGYAVRAVAMNRARLGNDSPRTAEALIRQGIAQRAAGALAEAEAALREAIAICDRRLGPAHPNTVTARFHLAQVLARRGQRGEAEALLRQALDAGRSVATPLQQANRARFLGAFLAHSGRPQEALPFYREALDTLDRLYALTRGQDEQARESFSERYAPFYREFIELLLRLDQLQPGGDAGREALAVASRGQSRVFTELLRQAEVGRFSGEPGFVELQDRQRSQQQGVSALRAALASLPGAEDSADEGADADLPATRTQRVRRALAQAEAGLAATEERLWREYPRYMEMTSPRPVTVDDLQQRLLRPGEALVTFALLEHESALFVVTRERFVLARAPIGRSRVADKVRALRAPIEQVAGGAPVTALRALDPAGLEDLYRLLIAPLEPGLAGAQRILVVPDGALGVLPLESLVSAYDPAAFGAARDAADGSAARPLLGEYALPEYLGRRYHFAYLPSLAALASQRLHPKPARPPALELAAFADPVFAAERGSAYSPDTRATLKAMSRSVRGSDALPDIPRLPETADEARRVAELLPGEKRLFLRDQAQERAAKGGALRDARYILFATHGFLGGEFLDPRLPAQPALALTLTGDLGGEDGFLTMKEVVQDLDLSAQLVALSACNTAGATDRALEGEGFAGLTRAFMYAGARGLLVSHWAVETRATGELVTAVFRGLSAGTAPVQALSQAQAEVRASSFGPADLRVSRSHPFFWAPFVYVGD